MRIDTIEGSKKNTTSEVSQLWLYDTFALVLYRYLVFPFYRLF